MAESEPDEDSQDFIEVNCGRCGKQLLVRVEDVRNLRVIDCEECQKVSSSSSAGAVLKSSRR